MTKRVRTWRRRRLSDIKQELQGERLIADRTDTEGGATNPAHSVAHGESQSSDAASEMRILHRTLQRNAVVSTSGTRCRAMRPAVALERRLTLMPRAGTPEVGRGCTPMAKQTTWGGDGPAADGGYAGRCG